jgi:proline dehydrogenase
MNLLHAAVLRALPLVPRSLLKRVAGRYIAGETIADVLRVARALDRQGLLSTVDVLGENATSEAEARAARDEYLRVASELAAQGLASQVSVKLTLLGLRFSEPLAGDLVETITEEAGKKSISVCLDMEDSTTTDAILGIYRRLRERHSPVSVAIQAYLRRSAADVKALLPLGPSLRICKGIYAEPPGIAFQGRREIQESYLSLLRLLVEGGGYPAIATHDPWLVDRALALVAERGLGPAQHEFQMLLGVGESLRGRVRASGSPLRLYCPYGPDWQAYSLRRLKENPRMIGYALKSVFSPRVLRSGPAEARRRDG